MSDSTKPSKRVSPTDLKYIVRSEYYLPPGIAKQMARELLEQRAAARYRQHLPGCKIWTYLKVPEYEGPVCTCGYDALPQHLKGTT